MENEKDMVETPAGENISSPAEAVAAAENAPAHPVENSECAEKVQEETCCCCCSDEKVYGMVC